MIQLWSWLTKKETTLLKEKGIILKKDYGHVYNLIDNINQINKIRKILPIWEDPSEFHNWRIGNMPGMITCNPQLHQFANMALLTGNEWHYFLVNRNQERRESADIIYLYQHLWRTKMKKNQVEWWENHLSIFGYLKMKKIRLKRGMKFLLNIIVQGGDNGCLAPGGYPAMLATEKNIYNGYLAPGGYPAMLATEKNMEEIFRFCRKNPYRIIESKNKYFDYEIVKIKKKK